MVDVGRPQLELRDNDTKKHLLAEGVFELIGERIVSGALPPGTRIRDAALAAELAVSRTPVREALQRMERMGLVTMYPSRYTEVTAVTPQTVEAARIFAGYQGGIIARMACPLLTDADLTAISTLISRIAAAVDDPAACSHARRELAEYLILRTDNPLQQALFDESSMALARSLKDFPITAEHRPRLLAGCDGLIAALRAGDADAAERAYRAIYDLD